MNGPTRLACSLLLLGLAVPACSKKKAPPAADTLSHPAGEPAGGGATAPTAASKFSPAALEAMAKAGVHPDVANSDQAYEAWFKKYGLDLNDPKMLDADADGDGYTNGEEFLAGTDPLDPNSHPSTHQAMKMKEYTGVDVPFVLRSVEGDSAQIETAEGGEKHVETVKAGQTLRNSPYRISAVKSLRSLDKDGNPVDASRVTLENPASKEKVELVKNLPTRSSASYAVLTSADGTKTITVHQGDTFSWPGEPQTHYTVKDLRNDQVILQQEETQQMVTVRKQP